MPMHVRPLTPTIGAVIEGVDLAQGVSADLAAALRQELLKHQVLFFEGQDLTPVQHRDFAARFGALHTHPLYPGVPEAPELFTLDNHAGNPTDNDAWHTDVTFIETPPMGSILHARLLPPNGGDTIWASMKAAYEALSPTLRSFLETLDAVHDFARGFPQRGIVANAAGADKHAQALAEHPPVLHPVVRTHPETGEDALFVNFGFTERIKGLRRKESDAILHMLFEHVTRPEFQVRWRWTPNAIAFWDNRITQHYAVNDYLPARRVMIRATILGERPYHRSRRPAEALAAE
ncbi:taurine dioxygenase [Phenylobacterium sp. SCN 70-31]|uniref:taurine dioxygenase n=1 Tax=Phenylobacterium sp. SCN 70-31 TaxID=1660129 RepID=UPI00086DF4A2|nr:taurine dioxygenase [Phenylobacterium sp. SCN 70-31]ODT88428.1 MAG: taurine dioxygenase [Phenylobacterium sp. SCN 70-31]